MCAVKGWRLRRPPGSAARSWAYWDGLSNTWRQKLDALVRVAPRKLADIANWRTRRHARPHAGSRRESGARLAGVPEVRRRPPGS